MPDSTTTPEEARSASTRPIYFKITIPEYDHLAAEASAAGYEQDVSSYVGDILRGSVGVPGWRSDANRYVNFAGRIRVCLTPDEAELLWQLVHHHGLTPANPGTLIRDVGLANGLCLSGGAHPQTINIAASPKRREPLTSSLADHLAPEMRATLLARTDTKSSTSQQTLPKPPANAEVSGEGSSTVPVQTLGASRSEVTLMRQLATDRGVDVSQLLSEAIIAERHVPGLSFDWHPRTTSVRIKYDSPEVYDQVKAAAAKRRLSVAAYIRQVLADPALPQRDPHGRSRKTRRWNSFGSAVTSTPPLTAVAPTKEAALRPAPPAPSDIGAPLVAAYTRDLEAHLTRAEAKLQYDLAESGLTRHQIADVMRDARLQEIGLTLNRLDIVWTQELNRALHHGARRSDWLRSA